MAKGIRAKSRRETVPICRTCTVRSLKASDGYPLSEHELEVFRLKVRDYFGAEASEYRPCLSRCPEFGVTVERKGRTHVLASDEIRVIQGLFDPTRQLALFDFNGSEVEESTGEAQ